MFFFISDTHFSHTKIISYCNRPFSNVEEMNKKIIDNWNSRVKSNDTIFFLGDWGFTKSTEAPDGQKFDTIRPLLKGNIIFLDGSHDKNNGCKTPIQNLVIKLGGKRIFLVHDPEYCNVNYNFNICGHVHEKWKFKRFRKGMTFTDCCNVSVEQWNYCPVTISEILQAYSQWLKEGKYNE